MNLIFTDGFGIVISKKRPWEVSPDSECLTPRLCPRVKMKAEDSVWTTVQRGPSKDIKRFYMRLEVSFPSFEINGRAPGSPGLCSE